MSTDAADNANNIDSNNIVFTIKDTIIFFCSNYISKRQSKTKKNFLAKDLKDHFIGTNIIQKVRMKIRQMN